MDMPATDSRITIGKIVEGREVGGKKVHTKTTN